MTDTLSILSSEIVAKVQAANLGASLSSAQLTRVEKICSGQEPAPKGINVEKAVDGAFYLHNDSFSGVCVDPKNKKIDFSYDRKELGPVKGKNDREGLRQDGIDSDFEAFTEKTLKAHPELKSLLVGYQYGSKTVTEDTNGAKSKPLQK